MAGQGAQIAFGGEDFGQSRHLVRLDRRAAELGLPGPEIVGTRSELYPDSESVIGWDIGGTGFRISVEENAPDEGHRFEASGIPVVMDEQAFRQLRGAVLEIDPDPAGDGFRLDHPNAVMTTFC